MAEVPQTCEETDKKSTYNESHMYRILSSIIYTERLSIEFLI
jgi:hypothetical protein